MRATSWQGIQEGHTRTQSLNHPTLCAPSEMLAGCVTARYGEGWLLPLFQGCGCADGVCITQHFALCWDDNLCWHEGA